MKIRWYISMINSSEIQFDPFWSILIHFDPFLSILTDLIKSDQKNCKSDDIFQWLLHQKYNFIEFDQSILINFDPFWTDLIQSDQKINKVENLMIYFNDYFIKNPIWSIFIHFEHIWLNQIKNQWSEKSKRIFNDYLSKNQIWLTLIY